MNTKRLNAWALVNKQTNQIEALEFTREDARSTKRVFKQKGLETQISKLAHEKFCR